MSDSSPVKSDPVKRRDAYVAEIQILLRELGINQAELDRKINRQLETDGGIDALGFDGLEKVIAWL